MGIANKELVFDQKEIIDSLQHIYDQLQMIDHVLEIQVDRAIHETFQQNNQQLNEVMKTKSSIIHTYRN